MLFFEKKYNVSNSDFMTKNIVFTESQSHLNKIMALEDINEYKDNIKIFLEKESEKYGLGSVNIEEKEYSDFDPVYVIDVPESLPFEEMSNVWDNIVDNTEDYVSLARDKNLINFYKKIFIILRK